MTQANELRIGNCHYINGDQIGRITAQGILYVDQGTIEFKPVPLTYEILEKCGFVHDGYTGYSILINKTRKYLNIPFDSKCEARLLMLHHNGVMTIAENIQFLHQLQNLYFALSGEELIVNL